MERAIRCDRCNDLIEDGFVFDITSFTPELMALHSLCRECAEEIEEAFDEDEFHMIEETDDEYWSEKEYAYRESQWEMDMER